jgi:hypothetical protein
MWINWGGLDPAEAQERVAELRSREAGLFEWLRGCMTASGGPAHLIPDVGLRDLDEVFAWAGGWLSGEMAGPVTPPEDPFNWRPDRVGKPIPALSPTPIRNPDDPAVLRRSRLKEALLLVVVRLIERRIPTARFRPASDPTGGSYNDPSIEFEGQADVIGVHYMLLDQLRRTSQRERAPDELRRELARALAEAGHELPC